MTYHAGEATIASGASTFSVTFATFGSTSYAIEATEQGAVTFTGTKAPIFVVTTKSATGFTITTYNDDNAVVTAGATATVDWVAIANN